MLLKAPGDLGGLFLENVSPAAAFVLAMSVIAAVDQILKRSIRSDKGQRCVVIYCEYWFVILILARHAAQWLPGVYSVAC